MQTVIHPSGYTRQATFVRLYLSEYTRQTASNNQATLGRLPHQSGYTGQAKQSIKWEATSATATASNLMKVLQNTQTCAHRKEAATAHKLGFNPENTKPRARTRQDAPT